MNNLTSWLLEGPAWVQYRTRLDLLGQSEKDREVFTAREAMLKHPQVIALLDELKEWPGHALKRHNDAKHLIHKLTYLADLGFNSSDPALNPILESIMEHQSPEGAFEIKVNIPPHFGGSGEDEWQWMLCDAPSTLYALLKFGLEDNHRVQTGINHLSNSIRDNGWPCAAASSLGKFRGPGRKGDPCPYANLVALKALSQSKEYLASNACKIGADTLLGLWDTRKEHKPYLFGMGTDFTKLKAPLIWYDVLHVLDVLSQFSWLRNDPRLLEMVELVKVKADENGRYTPESIWMAWRGWDFGQKKEPSRWITLIVNRALKRINV